MIPFPKIHIAESVLNRVLNALDGEPSLGLTVMEPPIPHDPTAEGIAIEEKLETPAPPAASPNPAASEQGIVEASTTGASPFDGALMGAFTP